MKNLLFISILASIIFTQEIWINEIHYDNSGTDEGEFIELAVSSDFPNISAVTITLYNGNSGGEYDAVTLNNFNVGSSNNGFTFYYYDFPSNGIQNGAPDGVQLLMNGSIVDAVAYEGSLADSDGNPMEEGGEDYQTSSEEAQSISRSGLDGSLWEEMVITPGAINAL